MSEKLSLKRIQAPLGVLADTAATVIAAQNPGFDPSSLPLLIQAFEGGFFACISVISREYGSTTFTD